MRGISLPAGLGQRVVVLLYHSVGGQPLGRAERKYQVSLSGFRDQLREIGLSGRPVAGLADVWFARLRAPGPPPACLTFDDGRASDYQVVLPELQARGWRADFFLNPGTVGKPGYLDWPQVREMAAAGMAFQSHGYDHVVLSMLPRDGLREQLRASKHSIEDATGHPVEFLAAPFGLLTRRVVEAALAEGYRAVCTSWNWPARPGRTTVSRVAVYARTTTAALRRLLDGNWVTYGARVLRTGALYAPTRVLLRARPALWT